MDKINMPGFALGCNYWGADYGTDMWRHYDGEAIRRELTKLSAYGVKCMRVFPNWRDFQPVEKQYAWRGGFGQYADALTEEPVTGSGVSAERIAEFRDFCHAAEECGISLIVSIVTGWMSGRLFTPPAIAGKNPITDPEAMMWMRRYIHAFVNGVKDCPAIVMWDLGNECNCLGEAGSRAAAYHWTASVCDAIRSADPTRTVSSGMHGLDGGPGGIWNIADQGELTDCLSTHPYPSPTVGGDVEPYNRLRMTYLPTAQSLYYSGLSGRPVMIQESGTFSQTIGSREMSAQFVRIQVLSALAHNLRGYLWWCAWEQKHLTKAPYSWSMIERELGLFDRDRQPKPVAHAMKAMGDLVDRLPMPFPERMTDGVCVLTREQNAQNAAIGACTLAKQAGIELTCVYTDTGDLPDSGLYIMPAITGWQVIYRQTWDKLLEKVRDGAVLYISFNGGHLTDFPEVVGAESDGFFNNPAGRNVYTDAGRIPYWGKEILLRPTTAEVLLRNDEDRPVLIRNRVGKGYVYFADFTPELQAFTRADGFLASPYYGIYRYLLPHVVDKCARSLSSEVGVTVHPVSEREAYVCILNYSDHTEENPAEIREGWRIAETVYGSIERIAACDGCILRIVSDIA